MDFNFNRLIKETILIILTLNEEEALAEILEKAQTIGLSTLILDGGSIDNTLEIARQYSVDVMNVPKGKGNAFCSLLSYLTVFEHPYKDKKYLLMIDGDGSYDLDEFYKLFRYHQYDMVIGKREPTFRSFTFTRLWGNKLFNSFFSFLYKTEIPDLLSGYRFIKLNKLRSLHLESSHFELETEMTARFIKKEFSIKWVPVYYYQRKGISKLLPFTDGLKILSCMLRLRLK
jgi:dolichol-phosphate mannosyltransferase